MQITEDNIENELKKIGRVDPPPFLYTRIESRISETERSGGLMLRFALAAIALLVVINIGVIGVIAVSNNVSDAETIVSQMNMQNSNQLYHD